MNDQFVFVMQIASYDYHFAIPFQYFEIKFEFLNYLAHVMRIYRG